MHHTRTDQFLRQTQIAGYISGRDLSRRVALLLVIMGVCIYAGAWQQTLVAAACVLVAELVAHPLNRRARQFDRPVNLRVAVAVFVVNWLAALAFLAFGPILGQNAALAFVLAGFVWVTGILIHVSNTFGSLPIYNWSLRGPAFATIFWMLWQFPQNTAFATDRAHWLAVAALMVVGAAATLDAIRRQNDTRNALSRVNDRAQAHLTAQENLSRHDDLNNLMSRRGLDILVTRRMADPKLDHGITLFLIGVDCVVSTSDNKGQAAGDTVLRLVADRLRELALAHDGKAARLGGNEFAVLRHDIANLAQADRFGKEIADVISQPVPFAQRALNVSASVGIAQQGGDITTATDLFAHAEQALHMARYEPGNKVAIFAGAALPVRATPNDRTMLLDAMQMGEIVPYYQPKICTGTGRIIGLEALSRWQHPSQGLLFPCSFIPMINALDLQTAFMVHTTRCVLEDIEALISAELNPGQVSVNLPEMTLTSLPALQELVTLIHRYAPLSHHLTFEISEDIFVSQSADTIKRSLAALRDTGVRISLDDFGKGFTSLQHLRELALDELKLDTTFVSDLGVDPAASALIKGFLTIGDGLGVQVVAEGVERRRQLDMLREMGCRYVQGHYFGAAMPFSETQLRLTVGEAMQTIEAAKRRGAA